VVWLIVLIGLLGSPTEASRAHFRRGVASVAFEVQVRPPGTVEIAGFVYDRDGRGVKRACVELVAGGGAAVLAPVFSAVNGSYRFAKVPPGPARVTITVDNREAVAGKNIADHHTPDPEVTVFLRPLLILPAHGRVSVARVKRQADVPGQSGRWVEVAPLALDLEGYSAACRKALERPAPPARSRRPAGRQEPQGQL
jgi:hypothetical protein